MFGKISAMLSTAAILAAAAMCLTFSSCAKGGEEIPEPAAVTEDGKKIIKVYAWLVTDDGLYSAIRDFNAKSSEYKAELTEYASTYKEEPLIRLNTDLTTGNAPDILVVSQAMPVKSYIDKGLFADIYEFIDSDPDMKREDFLESVFRAYERDGRLCEIVPEFYIETVTGKTSLVGDKQGRTAEEFIALAETYPDKKIMNGSTTKSGALDMFVRYSFGSFIDRNTGKCSFDSEEFTALLEFCNRFPFEIPDGYFENEYSPVDEDYDLFNGNTLFSSEWTISSFTAIRLLERAVYGEPVTFMGFPGAGGNGAVIRPKSEYAIISDSANKEGAWEFMRYFYSEEYQDGIISSPSPNFPVRMSSLEILAENAKKGRYNPLERKYEEPVANLFGKEVTVGVNTDGDNRRIYDLIGSAAGVMEQDNYIYQIISDEAAVYFSGQRPVGETAEIIRNRVQNYLDENR
ncbi:MAG: extracellular solute-binding protein [Prevotella sp.]|nr:extracellular solute-binding protein [Prevotella sp.]